MTTIIEYTNLVKTKEIAYAYDANGNPTAMTDLMVANDSKTLGWDGRQLSSMNYNGNEYFYITNMQGDVVELVDISGNTVVQYKYDAWGAIIYQYDSGLGVANANPFRYRSYYYDSETGWYYLQSRYYNPSIGRFISADGQINEGILGDNFFAYCYNGPINYVDIDGMAPQNFTWRGWKIRVDGPHVNCPFSQPHIHVSKGGRNYSQNDDGTPHDGLKGNPPKSVIDMLNDKLGWRWVNHFSVLPEEKPTITPFPALDTLRYIERIPSIDPTYNIDQFPSIPTNPDIDIFPESPNRDYLEIVPELILIYVGTQVVAAVVAIVILVPGGYMIIFALA